MILPKHNAIHRKLSVIVSRYQVVYSLVYFTFNYCIGYSKKYKNVLPKVKLVTNKGKIIIS
jgi:hypothetical protein